EALRILTDKDTDLNREFGQGVLRYALTRAALELAVGRLEDAAADLDLLQARFAEVAGNPELRRSSGADLLAEALRWASYQKSVLEGNYDEAGQLLEQYATARGVGKDPPLTPEQAKLNLRPFVKPFGDVYWQVAELATVSPLDFLGRRMLLAGLVQPFRER